MPYTLQANRSTTLAAPLNMGDTSVNISSAAFTDFVGDFLIVDYDNPLKLEIIFCNCTGTSLSSIVRGQNNTSDIDHATGAKVCYGFVPSHYEALVDGTGLADGAITAEKIATGAILLGGPVYRTSDFSTSNTTATQVTDLSITVTIPAGGRRVEVQLDAPLIYNTTTNYAEVSLWRGTVGSGTLLGVWAHRSALANYGAGCCLSRIDTPSAGSVTYNVGLRANGGGTATIAGSFSGGAEFKVKLV